MRCIKVLLLLLLLPLSAWAEGVLTPAANPPQTMTLISSSGIPFIKASSGTMGNNGAVSGMTALPQTYSGGAYLYLPSSAISAGSAAGWYWFVGSSTTAGTVYNSTYTSGIPVAGTATAFSTTGPGAFTGATGAITAVSVTIPATLIGANGTVELDYAYVFNNTVGNKVNAVSFGGTNCHSVTSTTQGSFVGKCYIVNRGSTQRQSLSSWYSSASGGTIGAVSATDATVATASAVTVAFTYNVATATDHSILARHSVKVFRQP